MRVDPRFLCLTAILAVELFSPFKALAVTDQKVQSSSSALFDQCLDTGEAEMGVMPAMIDCYDAELERKNVILNQIYQAVRKTLTSVQRRHLTILERQWIAHRDKKCKAEAIEMGGQDGQIRWYGCMIDETEKRTKWLEAKMIPKEPMQ